MVRIPALQQLSDNILFDKSSWESIPWILPENIQALNCAADRWFNYIKLNPVLITKMRKISPQWNGIRISRIKPIYIDVATASCGAHNLISYTTNGTTFKCPTKFWLGINVNRYIGLNQQQKCNILTHEFGHALGFSTRILKATVNGYTDNNNLPGAVTSYNNLMITNNFYTGFFTNNTIIPVENKGPIGRKNHHWEDDLRTINNQQYAGLKTEIMTAFVDPVNPVISKMSIKALVEGIGYIEKTLDASEGNPLIDTE